MIKNIFTVLFISISLSVSSQETLISFENSLKKSQSDIKDVIPIVNEQTGEIAFFVADAKNVYGYKFNDKFELTEQITSEEKSRRYKVLIGNSISEDNSYRVFLTNKDQNKFSSIKFSFNENTTSDKEFKLKESEKFIQTANYNNEFYLISGSKLTNGLYIHSFDKEGNPKRNKIDFSKLRFINSYGKNAKLLDLLIKRENIKKFEENTPNSIELTSEQRKMFIRGNSIFFSFDHHKMFTQVLKIDLNTFEASSFQFKKPALGKKSKRTNSYINGDYIFTVAATKEIFSFEILNFKTGEKIKEYSAKKNDSILFKNTPIIQEGGIYDDYRELGKTKRFLRRIASSNTGISVRNIDNKYHITIGGYVVQKMNGGMMMPFGGIPLASFGSATVFFNPTQLAFNSFANNKATRIESLLDSDFNHIKGDLKENAFDKMKSFSSNNTKARTVFKYKQFFIKTDYRTFSKTFTFKKFTD